MLYIIIAHLIKQKIVMSINKTEITTLYDDGFYSLTVKSAQYPFDGSWGYQTTGYFVPTSRYGEPQHLMQLIDKLHLAGIGAILDFVPVHFATDSYGLRNYDGTPLYEYPHGDVTVSEWGSCNFIYSRREAECFMQSAANFWLDKYHFDGLRMDAVSRMIYWHGDEKRGVDPNSLNFLKQMNQGLKRLHPAALLIAEDSSSYEGVARSVECGVLASIINGRWAGCMIRLSIFKMIPITVPVIITS